MTRRTNARIAGVTFLLYIAAGISDLAVFGGAPGTAGTAAQLARIVLSLVQCFAALVLAVTLYAITRDVDHELALLALTCRVAEGVLGTLSLSAFLAKGQGGNATLVATFFAVGSTLFSYLLLRGRMIPVPLAWLGVVASVLLVVGLPLQLAELLRGPVTSLMWAPMAAFEVPLGFWLLIKGVALPPAAAARG